MISQWKTLTVGVGVTALLLSGCQKAENAGTATEAAPAATTAGAAGATTAAVPAGNTSKPPFGFLDTPKEGATVAASSWAFGWALDDSGIAQVTVSSETGLTSPVAMNQTFSRESRRRIPVSRTRTARASAFPFPRSIRAFTPSRSR